MKTGFVKSFNRPGAAVVSWNALQTTSPPLAVAGNSQSQHSSPTLIKSGNNKLDWAIVAILILGLILAVEKGRLA